MRRGVRAPAVHTPLKSGELKTLSTVKQETLQIHLTNTSDGVYICTGAVVFSEVASQTMGKENTL